MMILPGGLAAARMDALAALIARLAGAGAVDRAQPYLAPALLFSHPRVRSRLPMPATGAGQILVQDYQAVHLLAEMPADTDLRASARIEACGALTEYHIDLTGPNDHRVAALDTALRVFPAEALTAAKSARFRPGRMTDTVFGAPIIPRQADIDEYVKLSGDRNAIHTDAAATDRMGLPGPIVPGLLLAALAQPFCATALPGAALELLKVRFMAPLFADEPVRVGIQLRGRDPATGAARMRACFAGPDDRALAVADLRYRA